VQSALVENALGGALAAPGEPQQDVLRADEIVAQVPRAVQRQLERLLRLARERKAVATARAPARQRTRTERLLNSSPDLFEVDPKRGEGVRIDRAGLDALRVLTQRLGRCAELPEHVAAEALRLSGQRDQQVLGADVAAVEVER